MEEFIFLIKGRLYFINGIYFKNRCLQIKVHIICHIIIIVNKHEYQSPLIIQFDGISNLIINPSLLS